MDRATKITLTTDAKSIRKLAEDPDLLAEFFGEAPANLLETARAIEEAAAQAESVDDGTLETLKRALRSLGFDLDGGEDATA